MSRLFFIFIFLTILPSFSSKAQDPKGIVRNRLVDEFGMLRLQGQLIEAEKTAHLYLRYADNEYQRGTAYSMLAAIYNNLGRIDDALGYLKMIEMLKIDDKTEQLYLLQFAYMTEALIFEKKRSYYQAIEYTEKAARLYLSAPQTDFFKEALSTAYQNIGTYYVEIREYATALHYLEKSMKIKTVNNYLNKCFILNSMAQAYKGLHKIEIAESYFIRSIEECKKEFGLDYYRIADFYLYYGEFLQNSGRLNEAAFNFRKGFHKFIKVYGEKNIATSRALSFLARNHLLSGSVDSALFFYQKSLIAVVKDFNDPDISKNPEINASMLDARLMDNLKGKSEALEILATTKSGEVRLNTLRLSLETNLLAINLIDVIRSNFPTPEIMFYISGAEKGTYMASLQVASKIFSITGNSKDLQEMYSIALSAKAAVLKNQISENTVLYSSILTDSLRSTQLSLNYNISGYNKLIYEESNKKKPDTIKINLWKDELFEMNKEKVRMSGIISENYPQFDYLLKKTIPVSVFEVQKKLEKDEIILDYFLENQYSSGKRKLYTFIVSRSDLTYFEQEVDSTFRNNALVLKSVTSPLVDPGNIKHVLSALHYFYNYLIKPSQAEIKGKRLIVVPDEEINRLPFEAFLPDEPDSDRTDFDGLHFLLNDYIISHSYSASLLPGKINRTRDVEIYSFSPSYGAESDELAGAVREIRSVSAIMAGRLNTVDAVTKSGFLHALKDSAIFHLAMHSISDTLNSLYSYLLFDESGLNADSAKLYNFEISLNNINSPMIVLSSCNSGAGNLFSGEGQLSLARSFVLAGASSVIRTAWEVNDESGSEIIIRFYYYLAKGFSKDRALQLAKLDFLNKSTPEFQNPYYWAAYEILGDNGPVIRKAKAGRFVVISLLLILPVLFYLRRRRIFSAGLR